MTNALLEDLRWQQRSELLKACADRGHGPIQTLHYMIMLEQGRPEDLQRLHRLGLITTIIERSTHAEELR